MRTVGVVTVGRSDYGIYQPILRRLQNDNDFHLLLFVAGMHLSPDFGLTVEVIEADGFEIAARIEMLIASDTPEAIAKSMGLGLIGFAQALTSRRPDILLVLGDRFEMMSAALAALPFKLPVAHIHGGEVTQGAIDEALRHSITKLSHLHFVATTEYANRVAQLGEEQWRITVSGAPSLDNLREIDLVKPEALRQRFGFSSMEPILVTFHPVTLEFEGSEFHVTEMLSALAEAQRPIIFTMPNADTGGRLIAERIRDFVRSHGDAHLVDNCGTQTYFSLMSMAAAMVGNSSSGIIEAASFKLPVVNIGSRQDGRTRAGNIIDVGYERGAIREGIRLALSPEFRGTLGNLMNPYSQGNAAETITEKLKTVELGDRLVTKRFIDLAKAGA